MKIASFLEENFKTKLDFINFLEKHQDKINKIDLSCCRFFITDSLILKEIHQENPEENYMDLIDEDLEILNKIENLSELNLSRCRKINGNFIKYIKNPELLIKLDLKDTSINSENLTEILNKCVNIEEINLILCKKLKELDKNKIKNEKNVKLYVNKCSHIFINSIPKNFIIDKGINKSSLILIFEDNEELEIDTNKLLNPKKYDKNIKKIIGYDLEIADGYFYLFSNIETIESIYLENCININGTLFEFFKNSDIKNLVMICTGLTGSNFRNIFEYFKNLETLNISESVLLKENDLTNRTDINLKKIIVNNCDILFIDKIRKKFKNVEVIYE